MKPEDFQYFKKYPQFLLCPMFSPLMFEGNPQRDDNAPPVRVWRLGSIINSGCIGLIPQILLIAMDQYRKVPTWYQDHAPRKDNNALIKHTYGNLIFSITSLFLYLCLTTIFFTWDKIFIKDESLCKSIFPLCPNPSNKSQSEESDHSLLNYKDDPEKGYELSINAQTSAVIIQEDEEGEKHAEV